MTLTTRPLGWAELALLPPLLAPLSPQFPDAAAFEAWRTDLEAAVLDGRMGVQALWDGTALVGGVLFQGRSLRLLLAGLGEVATEGWRLAFAALRERSTGVVWDEDVGPGWAAAAADLGARTFVRRTLVQALRLAEITPPAPSGLALRPWAPGDAEPAAALIAAVNAGTLDGVFLTLPEAPSEDECRRVAAEVLAGSAGRFLPEASFVVEEAGEMRGVLLAVESAPGQATLHELAVHPAVRGRQAGRELVQAMQRSLIAAGWAEVKFLILGDNAPVHRLFRPEELVSQAESRGGYWLA